MTIPSTALTDPNIQLEAPSGTHVQSDGSNIGGQDPQNYGFFPPAGDPLSLTMFTQGVKDVSKPDYGAWELYWIRPELVNTGNIALELTITPNSETPTNCSSNENDVRLITLCNDGKVRNFNMSAQWLRSKNMLQIANSVGKWMDTGITALFPNDQATEVIIEFFVDKAANVCSVVGFTINGTVFNVPTTLQKVPGVVSTWKVGSYVQLQNTIAGNVQTLKYATTYSDIGLYYW